VEPEYSQLLKRTGRCQLSRRLVPFASSRMDVYVNSPDRRLRLVSNQKTPLRDSGLLGLCRANTQFLGKHGRLCWSGLQPRNREEREGRRGHRTLCRYSFRISNLEKTLEYRRNLQLDDTERQSVLLVLLVNHRFGRLSQVDREFLEREIPSLCM
jgi:hypothetical protein